MGRHTRATTAVRTTSGQVAAASAPRHGRHRGTRRRPAPVRAGLLGASAAVAVGAIAVGGGLVPGPGGAFTVGDTRAEDRVRADGSAAPAPRGSRSGSPTDRPSRSAERDELRKGSSSPSESASRPPEKRDAEEQGTGSAPPGDTADPPRTRSAGTGTGGAPEPGTEAGAGREAEAEARVLSLVNAERSRAGCGPLNAEPELAALAGSHSEDMAERGYFSHTTPDGRSPWDRAAAAGVEDMGGENIARGQADAAAVTASWMDSPGHRANILNCDFRTLGVGAHFAPGGPWWTQTFGY